MDKLKEEIKRLTNKILILERAVQSNQEAIIQLSKQMLKDMEDK